MSQNSQRDVWTSGLERESRLVRKMEAAEAVAYHAEEFLDRLEKRWPEVTDMDDLRATLLKAISELRML